MICKRKTEPSDTLIISDRFGLIENNCSMHVYLLYLSSVIGIHIGETPLVLADEVYSTLGLTTTVYETTPWMEGKVNWLVSMYC